VSSANERGESSKTLCASPFLMRKAEESKEFSFTVEGDGMEQIQAAQAWQ